MCGPGPLTQSNFLEYWRLSRVSHPCLRATLQYLPQYIFDCLEAGELLDAASSKYLVIFKNGSESAKSKPQKAIVRKRSSASETLKGAKEKEKENRVSWDTKDVEKSEMRKEKLKGKENRKSLSNLDDAADDEDLLEGKDNEVEAQGMPRTDVKKKSSIDSNNEKKNKAKATAVKPPRRKSSSSSQLLQDPANTRSSEKGEAEFSFSVPGSPVLPAKRRLSNARSIEDSPPLSPSPKEKKSRTTKKSDPLAVEPAVVADKKASAKAQRDIPLKPVPVREVELKRKTPIGSQDSVDGSVLKCGRVEGKLVVSSGPSTEDRGRGKTKVLIGSEVEEKVVNTKTREDSPCW
jgi:hypothetical protein